MSLAFVFPGQGSQSVGMLDWLADDAAARQAIAESGQALGEDLGGLIHAGPAETLALTVNTQPAMLLAGVLCFRAWREAGGPEPAAVAGHSLGEYTALTAADSLSLPQAIGLVRVRAQAMQEAVPVGEGSMAAILGLDDATVQKACEQALQGHAGEVVAPANFNAPAQVVIAGHREAVERACVEAKALGAKRALPLAVSAPFHSSLLKPAGDRLAQVLTEVDLRSPRYTLVNNVDVATPDDPAAIRDALVRQSYSPVRWVEVVRKLADLGVRHVIEFGPGKVLAGLTSRIDKSLKSSAVHDRASLQAALAEVRGEAA